MIHPGLDVLCWETILILSSKLSSFKDDKHDVKLSVESIKRISLKDISANNVLASITAW